MIEIINLTKTYGDFVVFNNLNLKINKGECVAIIGPSGVGKSSMLRLMALLERPNQGNIFINGIDITQKKIDINKIREKMGMVYQEFHLFSHLSVIDNITLALIKVKKLKKDIAIAKAMKMLELVSLVNKAESFPDQLSGGQKQRVAIARSLVMEPDILFFDEPTSALDPKMTAEVLSIVKKLLNKGITILISTHEMNFAGEVADRILYIDEAGIYEEGTPAEIFEHPKREKTKNFIRNLSIFNYKIDSKYFDFVAMMAEIQEYSRSHNFSKTESYHVQIVIEELTMEILKSCHIESSPLIEFSIDHNPNSGEIMINFGYYGIFYNPFNPDPESEQNIGILLLTKIAKSIEHKHINNLNQLIIKL